MDLLNFLLFVGIAVCTVKVSQQGPSQRKLYSDLMTGYNPLERPVFNDSQSLTVYFGLSLMQIMDVDEKNQVLTTNIWLQLMASGSRLEEWMDDYEAHLQRMRADYRSSI